MTQVELKRKIIKKIYLIKDQDVLNEVSKIIGIEEDSGDEYNLTEEQLAAVEEARQQYLSGDFIENDELEKEIEKWLNG